MAEPGKSCPLTSSPTNNSAGASGEFVVAVAATGKLPHSLTVNCATAASSAESAGSVSGVVPSAGLSPETTRLPCESDARSSDACAIRAPVDPLMLHAMSLTMPFGRVRRV